MAARPRPRPSIPAAVEGRTARCLAYADAIDVKQRAYMKRKDLVVNRCWCRGDMNVVEQIPDGVDERGRVKTKKRRREVTRALFRGATTDPALVTPTEGAYEAPDGPGHFITFRTSQGGKDYEMQVGYGPEAEHWSWPWRERREVNNP